MIGAPLLGTALGDFHSDDLRNGCQALGQVIQGSPLELLRKLPKLDLRKFPKVPVGQFSQLFPSHPLPQRSWIERSRQKMNNMDLRECKITERQQKTWC